MSRASLTATSAGSLAVAAVVVSVIFSDPWTVCLADVGWAPSGLVSVECGRVVVVAERDPLADKIEVSVQPVARDRGGYTIELPTPSGPVAGTRVRLRHREDGGPWSLPTFGGVEGMILVPEPEISTLLGVGVLALALLARRR